MPRTILYFALLFVLACGEPAPENTTITGQVDGGANLTANLDRLVLGGEREMLTNTDIGADGTFAFDLNKSLPAGVYQIRVGAQRATFALEEGAEDVMLSGDLTGLLNYDFAIEGSEAAEETILIMRRLMQGRIQGLEALEAVIDSLESPYTAALVAQQALRRAGEAGLPIQRSVVERLPEDDPNRVAYTAYLDQLERQIAFQQAQQRIQVGQPAPDITLQSPDGKTYSLSDLKGQVVLLDFWAAWCGPCRKENPNVVKVYERYKDQGFTVFSVSLDGVGEQRAQRMTEEQLAEARENQRRRWVNAIEQDGLSWPYHVSELKHWNGEVTADYGVRAIPATFMIDREGNIAEVGLRGARSIEAALQRLLSVS